MLGNEQRSQENGQNTDLGLSSMGEQNQKVVTNEGLKPKIKINLYDSTVTEDRAKIIEDNSVDNIDNEVNFINKSGLDSRPEHYSTPITSEVDNNIYVVVPKLDRANRAGGIRLSFTKPEGLNFNKFKESIESSNFGEEKSKEGILESIRKYAEEAIEQNQEQRQTTQQVEEVATNITEEEQVKINLERLNAYIEAKKQREQEQQVQVSQSEEAISNKEESKITKDSIRQSLDEFEIFSNSRNLAKSEIIKILELIPKDLRDNPLENGFYKDAGITEDFIKSNKKEDLFKELNDNYINDAKNSIIAEFYTRAKIDGSNPELVKAVEDLLGNVQQNEAFSVNEQPQTIEQPSEIQKTPLVSESKSTNGKYTIRVEQNNGIGTAKILDNNGNEVKLTNKQSVLLHTSPFAY